MEVFLNDRFMPLGQASIPVTDLSVQRGYGIFDFFRLQENVLLYVEDHLARFRRSADALHLPVPYTDDEMHRLIRELADRNGLQEAGIKMILTGGASPDGWQIGKPALLLMATPMSLPVPSEPKSVRVSTHDYLRDIPEAKTINYTTGVWLQKKMKSEQADDVIYHHDGFITELPRCNVFIVKKDKSVVTPQPDILEGITRKRLLEIDDMNVSAARVTWQDLQEADEVFLTSSTKRIQAIVSIDGKPVGNGEPGPVTCALLGRLLKKERNYIDAHR